MRHRAHRRQLQQSPRSLAPLPHGPFGPVLIHTVTASEIIDARRSKIPAA